MELAQIAYNAYWKVDGPSIPFEQLPHSIQQQWAAAADAVASAGNAKSSKKSAHAEG